jgi:hypothetical protein
MFFLLILERVFVLRWSSFAVKELDDYLLRTVEAFALLGEWWGEMPSAFAR